MLHEDIARQIRQTSLARPLVLGFNGVQVVFPANEQVGVEGWVGEQADTLFVKTL